MKLTWFGETAFRFHIGGAIVVVDAARAVGVDAAEIVSGADTVLDLTGPREKVDGLQWKPRRPQRLLEAGDGPRPLSFWSLGAATVLVEADEDRPLVLIAGPVPELGRWVEQAVVVLAGPGLAERGRALATMVTPHLVALAGADEEVDAAFPIVSGLLDGAGMVALEPRLAVEV